MNRLTKEIKELHKSLKNKEKYQITIQKLNPDGIKTQIIGDISEPQKIRVTMTAFKHEDLNGVYASIEEFEKCANKIKTPRGRSKYFVRREEGLVCYGHGRIQTIGTIKFL